MAEKRRTYEERVREREDAVLKLESNLAASRLAAAQAKPFNPESLVEKPVDRRTNRIFMGAGVAIILFLIVAVIFALLNQAPDGAKRAKTASSKETSE